jgi:hypothetical protein
LPKKSLANAFAEVILEKGIASELNTLKKIKTQMLLLSTKMEMNSAWISITTNRKSKEKR